MLCKSPKTDKVWANFPSNTQNSDRLRADFGPSNPQYRGQPYIGASGVLHLLISSGGPCSAQALLEPVVSVIGECYIIFVQGHRRRIYLQYILSSMKSEC